MKLLAVLIVGVISVPIFASASVIGLKGGVSKEYMVLSVTKHGDVALSVCPLTDSNPIVDCDPRGTSTVVTKRSLFDSKLALADRYDETSVNESNKLTSLKSNRDWHQSKLNDVLSKIDVGQKNISQIDSSIALLTKQIEDVKKRLLDPNLDPQDKVKLQAFIAKCESDINKLTLDRNKLTRELQVLAAEKASQQSSIADLDKKILESQDLIRSQKSLLEKKVLELKDNLDRGLTAVAYENESLYFVSFFAFDKQNAVLPETLDCRAEGAFVDGFGNVRAKLSMSPGIFPKVVELGDSLVELYDGAVVDVSILQSKKFNWNQEYDKDFGSVFDFPSAYSQTKVACADRNGFDGRKSGFLEEEFDGDLIPGSTSCNGKPARRYTQINISYMGHFDRATADVICKSFRPIQGYDRKGEIFNQNFYRSGHWESEVNDAISTASFLHSLQVKGHVYLKDGYYAWGSSAEPLLFQYLPNKATLLTLEGTPYEQSMANWKLPTLCSARIESRYCED